MSTSRENLEECLIILSNQEVPNQDIIDTIHYVIDRYFTARSVHSCDIPGCLSCGNPEEEEYFL